MTIPGKGERPRPDRKRTPDGHGSGTRARSFEAAGSPEIGNPERAGGR